MQPSRILIFDSGVGGLSVMQEIRAQLPEVDILYAADNAAFPYGTKAESDLVARVLQVFERLLPRYEPDLVIIACNTASTVALPALRARLAMPVVGVVPAIKPAARVSRSGVIGLLATPGTVRRPYTDELIQRFAADCQVIRVGSSELVTLAERHLAGNRVCAEQLQLILAPFFEPAASGLDTIVLGCTHFPLLYEPLQQAAPRLLNWVDSGAAIACRAAHLLSRPAGQSCQAPPGTSRAIFTRTPATGLLRFLHGLGFSDCDTLQMAAGDSPLLRSGAVLSPTGSSLPLLDQIR